MYTTLLNCNSVFRLSRWQICTQPTSFSLVTNLCACIDVCVCVLLSKQDIWRLAITNNNMHLILPLYELAGQNHKALAHMAGLLQQFVMKLLLYACPQVPRLHISVRKKKKSQSIKRRLTLYKIRLVSNLHYTTAASRRVRL